MADMDIEKQLTAEELSENLQSQLAELESLESVFYNPGEIRVEDLTTLSDIKNFVRKKSMFIPPYLDLLVNLVIADSKFEFCISLPHEYPNIEPEIFVRNHNLNRTQHACLNKDLGEFIRLLPKGEPCIFSAISWLQENSQNYIESATKEQEQCVQEKNESLLRYWIYSHHIYSKTKRREICDLANTLHITGFCMPGKPGIICVEGVASDCEEWWQTIKSMTWKKIFCKVTEQNNEKKNRRKFLKFEDFQEVIFQNRGVKFNHMDMGELYKFLEDHKVGYIFKELFGVEAKSNLKTETV